MILHSISQESSPAQVVCAAKILIMPWLLLDTSQVMEVPQLKLLLKSIVEEQGGMIDTIEEDACGVMRLVRDVTAVGKKRPKQQSSVIRPTGEFRTLGELDGESLVSENMLSKMDKEFVAST